MAGQIGKASGILPQNSVTTVSPEYLPTKPNTGREFYDFQQVRHIQDTHLSLAQA